MDAWDRYEALIKILTKKTQLLESSRTFLMQNNTIERIKYVENLFIENNFLPFADVVFHNPKNDFKSIDFRKQGNDFFSMKNKGYSAALECYNQSICFAEEGSENLSIGYANRSAIYFEWKEYDLCLENIRLAKEAKYPERLMPKLLKREHECNENKKLEDEEADSSERYVLKLTHGAHPKVPYISEYLDFEEDDIFGRYVVATKDLNAGDVIAIEESFSTSILVDQIYERCANCLEENTLSLIPCENCTCAMYCSTTCKEDAYEKYHKYECNVIDAIYLLCTKINLIALRTVLTAIHTLGGLENLTEYIRTIDNKDINAFTLNYDNFDQREYYSAIHNLATNEADRTPTDLFHRASLVAQVSYLMLKHSNLSDIIKSEQDQDTFIELMHRHFQTASVNMHSLVTISVDRKTNKTSDNKQVGCASFAFMSLLNHSCAPNVVREAQGTSMSLIVNRPVLKGDQIFDNYGLHHCLAELEERQHHLKQQYLFDCTCEACENNYPLFPLLKYAEIPEIFSQEDMDKLLALDKSVAKARYGKFVKYLNEYSNHYPCTQISYAQESMLRCITILCHDVPLRRRYN